MERIKIGSLAVDKYLAAQKKYEYPILLIHGSNGGSWYMANYAHSLSEAGWDTYAINLRGHHPSDEDPDLGKVSLGQYVEDVQKVMSALSIENSVLIGHSMGGIIAQKTTEMTPTVKGMVMVASAPPKGVKFPMPKHPQIWLHTIKQIWGIIKKLPIKPNMKLAKLTVFNNMSEDEIQQYFVKLVPESMVVGMEVGKGIPIDTTKIKCPCLVMGFKLDALAFETMQQNIAKFYSADYIAYDGLAHFGMIEKGWERTAADLSDWLAKKVQ